MEHLQSGTAANQRALWIVMGLTFVYLIAEVIGGLLTNSLALLADAAHMLTDVGGIGLALFAAWMAQKPATPTKTYGYYRWEILAALINAVVLLGTSLIIFYEAYRRFSHPPEIISVPMFIVAVIGLIVNAIGVKVLHGGSQESLNVEGAFLETVSDTLGSLGVIIAAVIMWATGWYYADPIASVLISLFIFPRTWHLISQAVNTLLEGVPAHINVPDVRTAILDIDPVVDVHDLHVWTVTSGIESLSAHVVLRDDIGVQKSQQTLERISTLLKDRFEIEHSTIQLEFHNLESGEPPL